MGQSPDAHICFGVELEEGHELWPGKVPDWGVGEEASVDEFDKYLALRAGHKDPWEDVPKEFDSLPYTEQENAYAAWKAERPDWDKRTSEWYEIRSKFEKEAPIEILFTGTYDYSQDVVAIRGTHKYAYGYSVERVEPGHLCATDIDLASVLKWCQDHEINVPDKEEWAWIMWATYG